MEVHIPPLVKKETVDEAKGRGYQDAFMIEENIDKKTLHVVSKRALTQYLLLAFFYVKKVFCNFVHPATAFHPHSTSVIPMKQARVQ